jgi:hypothetical protein
MRLSQDFAQFLSSRHDDNLIHEKGRAIGSAPFKPRTRVRVR